VNATVAGARHIRVQNVPEAGDNTRGEPSRQGVVEADLFWPLVKGEDVTRWRVARTDRYWFVPYETEGETTEQPSRAARGVAIYELAGLVSAKPRQARTRCPSSTRGWGLNAKDYGSVRRPHTG
jgi:hypothetical protein